MWKAFDEMETMGWIGPGRPRLVSVQSEGCAPVVEGVETIGNGPSPGPFPQRPHTGFEFPTPSPVSSVSVPFVRRTAPPSPSPRRTSFRPLRRCRRQPVWTLARRPGRHGLPGVLRDQGWIESKDRVVVFNTGTGIKYR